MAGLDCRKEVLSFTAMASVEFATVGVNTLYKAASLKGLSYFVFIAYSSAIGALVLLPLPFIFRRRELPSFQLSVLYRIVLLGLIGSPTLASAISNLTPAFTFILAVIFRFFLSSFIDGKSGHTKLNNSNQNHRHHTCNIGCTGSSSLQGPYNCFICICISFSTNTHFTPVPSGIITTKLGHRRPCTSFPLPSDLNLTQVMRLYPDEKVVVPLYFLCVTIIAAPVCFLAESDLSSWSLRPDITLVAVVLAGCFGPTFATFVHTWGLHLKGPLYVSLFKPFSIAIAAAFGFIFLADALSLGRYITITTILLVGFYAVIWGKAKEEDTKGCGSDSLGASPAGKTPLLQSYRAEDT
ncbi:WAT1-related protein [Trema orientale]|uniref:WAT1-related protein n=1 Tax=Trema orientale TaxID=63057 RepID=A0A2P5BTD5_TREOI|nr:WAT1-related protein [Trema orientale]